MDRQSYVPDAQIESELGARFRKLDGRIPASDIEVDVDRGEVTLRGLVSNRGQKSAAEGMAKSVHGVRDIHNQLRVLQKAQASATSPNLERKKVMPENNTSSSNPTSKRRPYLDVSNAAQEVPENVGYGAENELELRTEGQASRVGAGVGTDGGGEGGTSGNWGGDATQQAPKHESHRGHTSPAEKVPQEESQRQGRSSNI